MHPALGALRIVLDLVPFAAARGDDDARSVSEPREDLSVLRLISHDGHVPTYRRKPACLGGFLRSSTRRLYHRSGRYELDEVERRVARVLVVEPVEPQALEFL